MAAELDGTPISAGEALTLGLGNYGHFTSMGTAQPRALVTFRPAPAASLPPLSVRSVPHQREFASVKHAGLFGTLGHKRQAQLAGYDDALFTDAAGRVTEGTTWNVCFADGGDGVLWPDAEHLPGVTKRLVRQGLAELGLPSADASVGMVRARTAHAAFATNAVIGVRPVGAIDGVELPGDPGLLALARKAYDAIPETEL